MGEGPCRIPRHFNQYPCGVSGLEDGSWDGMGNGNQGPVLWVWFKNGNWANGETFEPLSCLFIDCFGY